MESARRTAIAFLICAVVLGGVAWLSWHRARGPSSPAAAMSSPKWLADYESMSEDRLMSVSSEVARLTSAPKVGDVDRAMDVYTQQAAASAKLSDGQVALASIMLKQVLLKEPGSAAKRNAAFAAAMDASSPLWRSNAVHLFGDERIATSAIAERLALAALQDEDAQVRQYAADAFDTYAVTREAKQGTAWVKLHQAMKGQISLTTDEVLQCIKELNR